MKKHISKFTLIEILAVVALLGILAGIGFGGYTFAMNSAKESSTRALFKRLESAFESCRTKLGYYPSEKIVTGSVSKVVEPAFVQFKFFKDTNQQIVKFSLLPIGVSGDGVPVGDLESSDKHKKEYLKEFLRVVDAEALKRNIEKRGSNEKLLIDGWGGVIYYSNPGYFNKGGFDLICAGPDGKFGKSEKTDIKDIIPDDNDTEKFREEFYDKTTKERVCDDIINF